MNKPATLQAHADGRVNLSDGRESDEPEQH